MRPEISREALDDHFKADGKDKMEAFGANRRTIEEIARRKYLAGQAEQDGSVLIGTVGLRQKVPDGFLLFAIDPGGQDEDERVRWLKLGPHVPPGIV